MSDTTSGQFYRAIANWSGRLILPAPTERRGDGGVFVEVENTPTAYRHLKGKTLWVRWHLASMHQIWLQRALTDIQFDRMTRESMANHNLHPTRLDGWSNVSPLESLAGARLADDVQVELDVLSVEPDGDSWALNIGDEPIQIVGVQKALVQFVEPTGDKHYLARHYHPRTGKFDGPSEILAFPDAGTLHPGHQVEHSSIANIENSPLNASGWYVYGERGANDTFNVQALEPVEALQLSPTKMLSGREETRHYFVSSKWQHIPLHRVERILIDNNGPLMLPFGRSPEIMEKRTRELWYKNDVALVVHTFGWRGGEKGDPAIFGLVPGHFSFGFARVVKDEFNGELRFDLVYRQVYGHNREGVIAGAQRWHAYMGSLARGWMYTLPVSDVTIRIPELTMPYYFGDRSFDPLQPIQQELALMAARYRTGPGNGASVVTPSTSCVKDSSQALFSAIRRLKDNVLSDKKIKRELEKSPNNFHTQRFHRMASLLEEVESSLLIPLGYVPKNWRGDNEEVAIYRRKAYSNTGGAILEALKAWKTMLPRRAEIELLRIFTQYGATMFDFKSANIGGEISGIEPDPPGVIL